MALTAQRPRVAAGDHWRFAAHDRLRDARSEETRRVLEVSPTRILCDLASTDPAFIGGRAEFTRDWNLLSRPALTAPGDEPDPENRWHWSPPYPLLRFPLAAGRSWQQRATVTNRATGTRNVHRIRARAMPATQVTVAAGRFDVLPVRIEATVASDDGQSQLAWKNAETLYYAPRANLFVVYEQSVTGPDGRAARDLALELLQYRPAP